MIREYRTVERIGIEPTTPGLQGQVAPLVHASPSGTGPENRTPLKGFGDLSDPRSPDTSVPPAGFEPATNRLRAECAPIAPRRQKTPVRRPRCRLDGRVVCVSLSSLFGYQSGSVEPSRAFVYAGGSRWSRTTLDLASLRFTAGPLTVRAYSHWSGRRESNPQPLAWQASVLPLNYFRVCRLRSRLGSFLCAKEKGQGASCSPDPWFD